LKSLATGGFTHDDDANLFVLDPARGAVRAGGVVASATPLHAGGMTIVVETAVRDSSGRLVAKVTQTQMVLRPRG